MLLVAFRVPFAGQEKPEAEKPAEPSEPAEPAEPVEQEKDAEQISGPKAGGGRRTFCLVQVASHEVKSVALNVADSTLNVIPYGRLVRWGAPIGTW